MKLEPVIGLEIHVQLKTNSKMFCGCSNKGEDAPANTTICPVCLGLPGTLPVINRQAVEYGIKIGLALNGDITNHSKFDRKNYFYPDLPKGYQISQFDLPIVAGGTVTFPMKDAAGQTKFVSVRLTRLHLEEDAAKLHHAQDKSASFVDFNRAGTPLAEIVTEPDLKTPEEAKAFLEELRLILRYLLVSDADMERGNLRCDANISLRQVPETDDEAKIVTAKLNPKTEVKNINSFRSVGRALEFEIKRQTKMWLDGVPPAYSSTRGWDDDRGTTTEQRIKEGSSDYRYFPEPDLPSLHLEQLADSLRNQIPELPLARRARLISEYQFNADDARTFVADKSLGDFTEQVMSELQEWLKAKQPTLIWSQVLPALAKLATTWILTKLNGVLTDQKLTLNQQKCSAENMAELISMIYDKKITGTNALLVLSEMVETGVDPSVLAEEKNLLALEDNSELLPIIKNIIAQNPKAVADFKTGKDNSIQFLVGQVMRATHGKSDPATARTLIEVELNVLET